MHVLEYKGLFRKFGLNARSEGKASKHLEPMKRESDAKARDGSVLIQALTLCDESLCSQTET